MAYTLPTFVDGPAGATPITAAALNEYATGINGLDARETALEPRGTSAAYSTSMIFPCTTCNYWYCLATGNITTFGVSTTGAYSGQEMLIEIANVSGSTMTITMTTGYLTTGMTTSFTIASSKVGLFRFFYSSLLANWVLYHFTSVL